MDLRSLLSPEQFEAATWTEGPVCILAGAGSGKTRVVTHRIAYLIGHKRARPGSVLAVTFTNKAAGEMKHRVEALVPDLGRRVLVGTFHGMSARLLRQYGDAVGVTRNFVIYDQDDAQRLMKRIVVDELGGKKEAVRPILSKVDSWQQEGLTPAQVPSTPWDEFEERARNAYFRYVERLAAMGAVDFGGLLVKLRDLLLLPAGREIKDRVRHLLVDEYQDVNRVQADIVLALAETAETVAVVGDDDQAIYGWRGASADNLKHFIEQTEGAHLVRLEDNYRSTEYILHAANGIIEQNELRLGKVLRPTGDAGRRVRVVEARDDIGEARKVIAMIQEHLAHGTSLEEVAVLYRTNATSRAFEDELRRAGLPYRLVGGVRFYDRKEVKDVLATLRAALNPRSDVDTLRMIGAVPRGIGDKSLAKVQQVAAREELSLLEAMAQEALLEGAAVPARARKNAAELAERVLRFGDRVRPHSDAAGHVTPAELNAKDAVALAIELSGVADRLEAEGTPEAEGRLENLSALLNAAAQHVEDTQATGAPSDVLSFLEAASLLGGDDVDPASDESGERITLMTLHSAKGLEYDVVFLVGLEEHGFPHSRAIHQDAGFEELEEERRLAYVGITRARKRLILSWAKRRMVQGVPKPRTVSRFLTELPRDVLEGDVSWYGRSSRSLGRMVDDDRLVGDDEASWMSSAARGASSRTVDGVEYEPGYGPGGEEPGEERGAARPGRRPPRQLPSALLGASPREVDALARSFQAVKDRLASAQAARPGSAVGPRAPAPVEDDGPASVEAAPGPATPVAATGGDGLSEGGRVHHEIFGDGSIVGFRGQGRLRSALVRFDEEQRPRVIIVRHLSPIREDEVRVVLDEVSHD